MSVVESYNFIRWLLLAVASALLNGAAPVFMRAGAKRSDPSFAAAVFATLLFGLSLLRSALDGRLGEFAAIGNRSLLFLALAGLISALACLCLFTALTGAAVGRVLPILRSAVVPLAIFGHLLAGDALGLWRLCCLVLILLGTVLMESRPERMASVRWLLHALLALAAVTALSLLFRLYITPALDEAVALPPCLAVACVLLWAFALARGKQKSARSMGLAGWLCVPLAAVCVGLALVADTLGARLGDWSYFRPVACLGFPAMLLFARIFLKEKLPGGAIFGMILVLLGSFAMMMGW
ncbi:MAG: EamA family transporter [Clostridia bacterium]|nr:EamA family transporter [Clostridia bacterium]